MLYPIQRNITFTALVVGEYMFCYKKSTDTVYTCTTIGNHINVVTLNTPVTYPVTLNFDSEECIHDYDIYVAPICDDELQVEINAIMESPDCNTYNIQRSGAYFDGDLPIRGCSTNVYTDIPHWFIEEFNLIGGLDVCSNEPPSNANFNIVVGVPCKCLCREWNVSLTAAGGSLNILYTNCIGEIVFESLAGPDENLTFCALGEVSVASQLGSTFTKTDIGIC